MLEGDLSISCPDGSVVRLSLNRLGQQIPRRNLLELLSARPFLLSMLDFSDGLQVGSDLVFAVKVGRGSDSASDGCDYCGRVSGESCTEI